MQEKLEQLAKQLPHIKLLSGENDKQFYGKDWTNFYAVAPLAIAFPKSIEDVQSIVKWAQAKKVALVPSGGRTGLSGGAVATQGELVVAMDEMNRILSFNEITQSVEVEAGVITEQLQNYALEQGCYYPVDFASAGSSQIGGNIATNAGGIKVIRYGMTRDWVIGLTVVTGTGEILHLNKGLKKNATGYDLKNLFIGSEGTLGIIVQATIQLCPPPKQLSVMVLGLNDLSAVYSVLQLFRQAMPLTAFEFFSQQALGHVMAAGQHQAPFATETPYYALIEFEHSEEKDLELAYELFEKTLEKGWCIDGVLSQSENQAEKLWQLREHISESIAPYKPYKNDIAVTVDKVSVFLNEVDDVVAEHYPDFEVIWFGHIGDGNLHLNILKPDSMAIADFVSACEKVNTWVFDIVARYEGSVSAEHGVGLLKKPYLKYSRSQAEIAYMQSIKKVFDPHSLLNPGKMID